MLELQKMAKRPFTLAYIELDNNASLREISSVATIDKVHVALASDSVSYVRYQVKCSYHR